MLQEVEVNLDNYKIVHLRPGPDVSVNKETLRLTEETVVEMADEAGTVLLRVEAAEWPERLISMTMPAHGLHVVYSGSNTLITVSPLCITQIPCNRHSILYLLPTNCMYGNNYTLYHFTLYSPTGFSFNQPSSVRIQTQRPFYADIYTCNFQIYSINICW